MPPPLPPISLGLLVISSRPWLSPPTVPTAAMSPLVDGLCRCDRERTFCIELRVEVRQLTVLPDEPNVAVAADHLRYSDCLVSGPTAENAERHRVVSMIRNLSFSSLGIDHGSLTKTFLEEKQSLPPP